MGAAHFKRMWLQQPKARQGIGGDMFDAWAVGEASRYSFPLEVYTCP